MKPFLRFAVVMLASLGAWTAHAITYIVPEDREMIQTSDDIVVATALASSVERTARGGIVTRFTLRIDQVLKGPRKAGDSLALTEHGGKLDGVAVYSPGTPSYETGKRYLVFTETNRHGEPVTYGASLGRFELRTAQDRSLAVRGDIVGVNGNLDAHHERLRDADLFRQYIRAVLSWNDAAADYFVLHERSLDGKQSDATFSRSSYLVDNSRWPNPTYTFTKSGSQPGADGPKALAKALSLWNGTASNIDIESGAQDDSESCSLCEDEFDGELVVQFNGPISEFGVVGRGFWGGEGNHTVDGDATQFSSISEGDIIIRDIAFAQCLLDIVVTHEVGHTLGFRHSNAPPPGGASTTNAFMNSSVSCGLYADGDLKQYDEDAAATVYGAGPVCKPPKITTHPGSKTIFVGQSTSLMVVVSGTTPLSYQWYMGTSGDTSTPVGTDSATLQTGTLTTTTSFWVRVTGQCGSPQDSNTATVTASCTPPSISAQPQSKTITVGEATSLSVSAAGSGPFAYQWFIGRSGIVSQPTGTNSPQLTDLSPTTTTSYWVRVTGECGVVNSNAAKVTVNGGSPCLPPVIETQPADTTVPLNGTVVLSVVVAGGNHITRWYQGEPPNKAVPVGTGDIVTVGPVIATTTYWAAVENSCDEVASRTVTVSTDACTAPSITTQPLSQQITGGQSATLSIVAAGTAPLNYAWFEGEVGDETTPVTSNASAITVGPLFKTTRFWARVTNSCGSATSVAAAITIPPPRRRAVRP